MGCLCKCRALARPPITRKPAESRPVVKSTKQRSASQRRRLGAATTPNGGRMSHMVAAGRSVCLQLAAAAAPTTSGPRAGRPANDGARSLAGRPRARVGAPIGGGRGRRFAGRAPWPPPSAPVGRRRLASWLAAGYRCWLADGRLAAPCLRTRRRRRRRPLASRNPRAARKPHCASLASRTRRSNDVYRASSLMNGGGCRSESSEENTYILAIL